ncbi:MAG: thermonuclease family protein [Nanoarchaeota archaeon]
MKEVAFLVILVVILIISNGVVFFAFNSHPFAGEVVKEKETSEVGDFVGNKVVTKVIDGDTLIIEGESVRLLGMDTDERGYPCYKEAKERLEELVLGKEVFLESDGEDKDQYDRYLRYVLLDGKNVNLQMVEEGMAVARFSPRNRRYKSEISNAEENARDAGRGCKWRGEMAEAEREDEAEDEDDDEEGDYVEGDYVCDKNEYNCGDFSSHDEAQMVFEFCGGADNDVHVLDKDGDGDACESLT